MNQLALFDIGVKKAKDTFDFGANADICRNRHKGNPASVEANPTAESKARDKQTILALMLCNHGRTWSKHVARCTSIPYTTASARLSELKAEGVIRETEAKKEGCKVVEIVK